MSLARHGGGVRHVWSMLAAIGGMLDPAMAQDHVRSTLRPWPDTSATRGNTHVDVRVPGATSRGAVTMWEVLEPEDPRWWTDPVYRPRATSSVLEQVLQVPLGSPWLEWRRRRDGPRGGCAAFQGETGTDYEFMDRDRYWVYRCASPYFGGMLESYAYLLGDSDQPTIERVRWIARPGPGLPRRELNEARRFLLAWLTARPDLDRGTPRGPQQWNDPLLVEGWEMFATPLGHIRLGMTRDEDERNPDSLLVLDLWSRILLTDEAAADSAYQYASPGRRFGRMPLPAGTLSALDGRWPGMARALRRSPRALEDLPEIRRSVEAVRAGGPKGDPKDRALVLFAATHWVWAFDDTTDTTVVRRIEEILSPAGLGGDWGHYDGAWHPSPSLLFESITGAGHEPWTDRAFLYFQETGWELNGGLDSLEQFRIVIDRGERFLRNHARSTAWADVARTVAMAHETAWSLAKASAQDEYVDWTLYAPEAPGHRARAIELYGEILRRWEARPPHPRVRNEVRHRLARLRLDVDTGTRTYYPTSC